MTDRELMLFRFERHNIHLSTGALAKILHMDRKDFEEAVMRGMMDDANGLRHDAERIRWKGMKVKLSKTGKEKFLETNYGRFLQSDVRNMDYYRRRRKKYPDDADAKTWDYVYRSKFQVHKAVLKQFFDTDCEFFSDDGGFGLREGSGEIFFRSSRKITISYIGQDDWNRAVYISDSGQIMKTADPFLDEWALDLEMVKLRGLYSSSNNAFDGEPDCHIKEDLEIEIVDGRKNK